MAIDPVTAVLDIGNSLIKHFFPDPAQQAAAEQKMAELQVSGELQKIAGQLAINQEEARSSSLFVAGWRPCVGWIGAIALGYAAIVLPIAEFVAKVWFGYRGLFPAIDTTITMQILFGLLGLGAYRTYEKTRNGGSR